MTDHQRDRVATRRRVGTRPENPTDPMPRLAAWSRPDGGVRAVRSGRIPTSSTSLGTSGFYNSDVRAIPAGACVVEARKGPLATSRLAASAGYHSDQDGLDWLRPINGTIIAAV
jgi:hypothetical protein